MTTHSASSVTKVAQESAMSVEEHFRKLEHLYRVAPVTRWYGASIRIGDGEAEVSIPVRPEFYHAAHAVHGSVYFRALDDAAFFAANSRCGMCWSSPLASAFISPIPSRKGNFSRTADWCMSRGVCLLPNLSCETGKAGCWRKAAERLPAAVFRSTRRSAIESPRPSRTARTNPLSRHAH
jgi:hypothetical protein